MHRRLQRSPAEGCVCGGGELSACFSVNVLCFVCFIGAAAGIFSPRDNWLISPRQASVGRVTGWVQVGLLTP